MNYIREYWDAITSGKIKVCKKIYLQYERLIKILDDENSKYYFNEVAGNFPVEFIEKFCKHSKGEWAGKPVVLELWQKAILHSVYGILEKETNLRKHREVLIVIARKNGKTTFASAWALYEFIASGEGGAQVFCTANKLDQAKLLYTEAKNMVNQSSVLKMMVKRTRTTLQTKDELELFSEFSPLGADSTTQDGLNPSLAVYDEIHASKTDDLYSVIKQGMSARREPLLIQITTNGFVREGLFDSQYYYATDILNGVNESVGAERFLAFIYEQDDVSEINDESEWIKSNPNLGVSKSYSYLREAISDMKSKPSLRTTVLTKDFNIAQKGDKGWLDLKFLKYQRTYNIEDLKGQYTIGGVDLSHTLDLTCATMILNKKDDPEILYVIQKYFMPADTIQDKIEQDKVPYDTWAEQGWITLTPGNQVDYSYITAWFVQMLKEFKLLPFITGYDRWSSSYWIKDMQSNGIKKLESVIQGPKTFGPAMDFLEARLLSDNVNYNMNPVLRWCLTNVVVKLDEGGNKGPDKRRSVSRIDGAVSLLDAVVVYLNNLKDYKNLQRIK